MKRTEADAIESEIEYELNSQQIITIENKINLIQYKLEKQTYEPAALREIDNELYGIIQVFFRSDSPFTKYPSVAEDMLLYFTDLVEYFMEKLRSLKKLYAATEVPCMLRQTLHSYIIPAILYRLNEIRVDTDQYKYYYKFNAILDVINPMFDKNPYPEGIPTFQTIRCQQIRGDKKEYERTVGKEFPRYKMGFSVKSIATATWEVFKGFFSGHGISAVQEAVQALFEVNMDENKHVFLRDDLGDKDFFYMNDDGNSDGNSDACVVDYFSLVGNELYRDFSRAYSKLGEICPNPGDVYEDTGSFFSLNWIQ